MSTPVKLIEKDFLIKTLYDEKLPVIFRKDRVEYCLFLENPPKEQMVFLSDRPVGNLKAGSRLDLMFDYRSKIIAFNVETLGIKGRKIICTIPDFLYKDLDRAFSRVSTPQDMQVQFTFLGDRYNLSFPKVTEYDNEDLGVFFKNIDPKNLSGLIDQMAAWIKKFASGYKLMIFKDTKPSTVEERVIAETGKSLYLPSVRDGFPKNDPYPRKRIITEDMFMNYLEGTGVGAAFVASACARFVKAKADNGFFSDAWIPVLFQEYAIGYIHIWINEDGRKPFDYALIETMYQFAKVLAHSLKINGYFESGKVKNDIFDGKVIDISASGLLFTYPISDLSAALLPDSSLTVKILMPNRSINTQATIVRRFKDNSLGYFGCHFVGMEKKDTGFLFERIYGKPFTELDASFLSGAV